MDLDDTLGLVLERLDSQATLIRAASTCKRWRSFIADPAFLRRFRSRSVIVGDYFMLSTPPLRHLALGLEPTAAGRTGPLFVPSSPAIDAGRYSLDFLAAGGVERWTVLDSRGPLLLLHCTRPGHDAGDMVVCEPLTQTFTRIPPPPDTDEENFEFWGCYLVDGETEDDAGGRIGMSKFRVMRELYRRSDGANLAAVFTAGRGDVSSSWGEKAVVDVDPPWPLLRLMGRAAGSWYFYFESRTMIVFDGSTGKYSSSCKLPATEDWDLHAWQFNFFVTEGRDRKPRVFTVFDDTMKVLAMVDDDGGGEWALEKTVLLSEATRGLPGYQPSFFNQRRLNILTRGPGFVILSTPTEDCWTFSVDLETMEAALASTEEDMGAMAYPCELPWPPAFSACLDQ